MNRKKFSAFGTAKYPNDKDSIAAYLDAAAESGDAARFANAISDVARATNLTASTRDFDLILSRWQLRDLSRC
jgi:DNA-binding phage protein